MDNLILHNHENRKVIIEKFNELEFKKLYQKALYNSLMKISGLLNEKTRKSNASWVLFGGSNLGYFDF